jgi:L-aminopeptidase/D-esterase-like protein
MGVALSIESAGAGSLVAGLVGAGTGALALAFMLRTRERDLLVEFRAVVSSAVGRQPA